MIDSKKVGKFIAELRGNMSQEKLGTKLGIGRDSISKWERGITLPSHEMLLKLSCEFNVSVNEILNGERLNKDNEEAISSFPKTFCKKNKKRMMIIILIIVIIILIYGMYFFINTYKKIKVYTVTGNGDNIVIKSGILANVRDKIYFSIDDFTITNDKLKVNMVTLYYKNPENFIYKDSDINILISDYVGRNEYFNPQYLNDLHDNLFLLLEYNNGESESIKLYLTEDYVNDSLIIKKKKASTIQSLDNNWINYIPHIPNDLKPVIKAIKNKYTTEDNNTYMYYTKIENIEYDSFYISDVGVIELLLRYPNDFKEEWYFDISGKTLSYTSINKGKHEQNFIYSENKKCEKGDCEDLKEKIEFFWEFLYKLV